MALFRRKAAVPAAKGFLETLTGKDERYWMQFVQDRIVARSRKSTDPMHDVTMAPLWVRDVMKELYRTFPAGRQTDGNVRLAAALGFILIFWSTHVARAKAYDPNRPVKLRQEALKYRRDYITALVRMMVDESQDADFFNQPWDPPFSPDALNGDFV